jgi:hypothetical protein
LHWRSKKIDSKKIIYLWEKGYRITHLFHDNDDWIYVFSKLKKLSKQTYCIETEFPQTEIRKMWDEGFRISKIAFGDSQWIILFLNDTDYNSGWVLREHIDAQEIKKWLDDGKIITDLTWGNNKWAIGFGKHIHYKYQIIETSITFPYEIIKKRWSDGYDITLCAYGGGNWHVVFSTKNKEKVISKEKERLINDSEKYAKDLELLYNEKKYKELIELFQGNKKMHDIESCVNNYLWSLWLHKDTEEMAFALADEFNSKFNTTRWNIIKGHYSKWKKKYDDALKYYNKIYKEGYNEVLKIFEDFRNLYREKKYKEVVDYFESNLYNSISKSYLDIVEIYLWSLFRKDGSEIQAYHTFKKFNYLFPNESIIMLVGGYITQWVGSSNNDINILEESVLLFKSLDKKEELEKSKEKILIAKSKLKEKEKILKIEEREKEKKQKQEAKEQERKIKEEEKKKEKEKKELEHKLKSSNGKTFCVYCGKEEHNVRANPCYGRKMGHNYVFLKDKRGRLDLKCNKCGKQPYDSIRYCT